MIFFALIPLLFIIGLNLIPQAQPARITRASSKFSILLISIIIAYIGLTALDLSGYRLKGLQTKAIIDIVLLASLVVYYVTYKNSIKKIVLVALSIPIFYIVLLLLLIRQPYYVSQLTPEYKVIVATEGVLDCGDNIHVTETAFLIFDKILSTDRPCIRDVTEVELLEISDTHLKARAHYLSISNELEETSLLYFQLQNK